jgi:hypothetical protein
MIDKTLLIVLIATGTFILALLAVRHFGRQQPYVFGQQMADARRNEEARLQQGAPGPSPLPAGKYEPQPGEWGLLNPKPIKLDAELRETCRHYRTISDLERGQFTSAVSIDGFYTLITFAQRVAVFGLRTKDAEMVKDGFTALAIIEAKRTDFRDIICALALLHHTASRIGVDPGSLLRQAAEIAEPEVAGLMLEFQKRDERYKNLKSSWGYAEAESGSGLGFARWGFKPYEPNADLLGMAKKLATIAEADVYHVSSIELATELPAVWLKIDQSTELQKTLAKARAGAQVSANLNPDQHPQAASQMFVIFIAEMDSSDSVEILRSLAQAKKPTDYQMLGIGVDRVFCLLVARSFRQGTDSFEKGRSLDRFERAIREAIGGNAG